MAGTIQWQVSEKNPEVQLLSTNDVQTNHLYRIVNNGPGAIEVATQSGPALQLPAPGGSGVPAFMDFYSSELTILIVSNPTGGAMASGTLEYLGASGS